MHGIQGFSMCGTVKRLLNLLFPWRKRAYPLSAVPQSIFSNREHEKIELNKAHANSLSREIRPHGCLHFSCRHNWRKWRNHENRLRMWPFCYKYCIVFCFMNLASASSNKVVSFVAVYQVSTLTCFSTLTELFILGEEVFVVQLGVSLRSKSWPDVSRPRT